MTSEKTNPQTHGAHHGGASREKAGTFVPKCLALRHRSGGTSLEGLWFEVPHGRALGPPRAAPCWAPGIGSESSDPHCTPSNHRAAGERRQGRGPGKAPGEGGISSRSVEFGYAERTAHTKTSPGGNAWWPVRGGWTCGAPGGAVGRGRQGTSQGRELKFHVLQTRGTSPRGCGGRRPSYSRP